MVTCRVIVATGCGSDLSMIAMRASDGSDSLTTWYIHPCDLHRTSAPSWMRLPIESRISHLVFLLYTDAEKSAYKYDNFAFHLLEQLHLIL